jgi:hypothetical protein
MIGCLVLAFTLCQAGYYQQGYYPQQQAYYPQQQQYYQPAPQVYYQPQPIYYAPQPVYVAQPIYGGGYGYGNPFGGINVAVGPRGGVRVGVNR